MIEFKNVTAGYGEFMILNDLSFEAARAKITLLLGPNGAGKSTVLKTLFGLLKVKQGSIHLDGKNITGASAKELLTQHGVAFVPQGATCSASSASSRTSSSAASRSA
jgi:branched-chain amino acid transport system ATP-binding protein